MSLTSNSRRSFLSGFAKLGAAAAVAPGLTPTVAQAARTLDPTSSTAEAERRKLAYEVRNAAALYQKTQAYPEHPVNGDALNYPSGVASYSKGVMQNAMGEPDSSAFFALSKACKSGKMEDYDLVMMGGTARFQNPLAANAYTLEGADSHQLAMPAPPACSSAITAAEMVENYWRALSRDVAFTDYSTSTVIQNAVAEMNTLSGYTGPKAGGKVTPDVLFRGQTPGDAAGPIVSQFLLKPIPYGGTVIPQTWRTYTPGVDYMTTYAEWLNVQNGIAPSATQQFDSTPRYIRNLRDLAAFVHSDYPYEAFLNAACILQGLGAAVASKTNPYAQSSTMTGFVTFGPVMVFDLVARVTAATLKAAFFQKWALHMRIRPEQFAGRVHNQLTSMAMYPIHQDLLKSNALKTVFAKNGNYLLPQAYPEGAPLHPSYPAGHACIAGACATVLKAFYNEAAVLASPVMPSSDGMALNPYTGGNLTVGNELNKLAANIALGRDSAGVHYRSDGVQGLMLGEQVATQILREYRTTLPENYPAFSFTGFSGTPMYV